MESSFAAEQQTINMQFDLEIFDFSYSLKEVLIFIQWLSDMGFVHWLVCSGQGVDFLQ